VTREVNYEHTFEAVTSNTLEDGTRVLMGLCEEVMLPVDVHDEDTPPVEAATIQVGLWRELVSMQRKVYYI
jgi:hypothetical protein